MSRTRIGRRRWGRAARASFVLSFLAGIALILSQVLGLWSSVGKMLGDVRAGTDGLPLLVNAEHALPADFDPGELVALAGEVPVSSSAVTVADEVREPLGSLFAAARKAGVKRLYVASGYRTAEEQQALWDAADDRSYVQAAGHSEHQTGLAVDLADTKVGSGELGDSKAGRWLAKNAWRHGFILRYPEGREAITGISYEPWHFRYVGKAVAKTCHEHRLTLEEYVMGYPDGWSRA